MTTQKALCFSGSQEFPRLLAKRRKGLPYPMQCERDQFVRLAGLPIVGAHLKSYVNSNILTVWGSQQCYRHFDCQNEKNQVGYEPNIK